MIVFEKIDGEKISVITQHILYIKWGEKDRPSEVPTIIVFDNASSNYIEISHDVPLNARSLSRIEPDWRQYLKEHKECVPRE